MERGWKNGMKDIYIYAGSFEELSLMTEDWHDVRFAIVVKTDDGYREYHTIEGEEGDHTAWYWVICCGIWWTYNEVSM